MLAMALGFCFEAFQLRKFCDRACILRQGWKLGSLHLLHFLLQCRYNGALVLLGAKARSVRLNAMA